MAICQYYLKGTCRFGSTCRYEHPQDRGRGTFGAQSWSTSSQQSTNLVPIGLFSVESIGKDLSLQHDKPSWPLSSYGPAKYQPTIIGQLDESPEELRVRAVTALKAGNVQEYMKYEADKIASAEQAYASRRANLQQLYNQAMKGDVPPTSPTFASGVSAFGGTSSAFGAPTSTSAFGKPSGFGAFAGSTPSAFGSGSSPSTFGSNNTPSAFGTGSTQTPTPSAFGSGGTSAFGSASGSALGQPGFGQTAFGQPSTTSSAFGQPSQGTPVFGAPTTGASAFGSAPQTTSAFGQAAQGTSAFGQPSQGASAFGQSSFGQTSQPSSVLRPATGAFGSSGGGGFSAFAPPTGGSSGSGGGGGFSAFAGQPSAFAAAAPSNTSGSAFGSTPTPATTSAFANPGVTTSAFGAPATGTPSAFGAGAPTTFGTPSFGALGTGTSAFGSAPQGPSAFGSVSQGPGAAFGSISQGPSSAFGAATQSASAFNSNPQSISTFGAPSQPTSTFSGPLATTTNTLNSSTSSKKGGRPDFANAKSMYRPGMDKYDSLLPDNYLQILPKAAREAFESKNFEWGNIPEWIPPKELR